MFITIKDLYLQPFADSVIHPISHQKRPIIPVQRFGDMDLD